MSEVNGDEWALNEEYGKLATQSISAGKHNFPINTPLSAVSSP
jgi:hypothetical protein